MEGDCNVYAHSSLCMRPTGEWSINAKMVYREGFFPIQNAKPLQTLPYKIFFSFSLYLDFHIIFLFICISFLFSFFFSVLLFPSNFLFFFPKSWNSSPKWKNYSPAFGANNRRTDAPVWSSIAYFPHFTVCYGLNNLWMGCIEQILTALLFGKWYKIIVPS